MPFTEKQQRVKDPERPGYAVFRKGVRVELYALVALALVVIGFGVYLSPYIFEASSDGSSEEQEAAEAPAAEEEVPEEEVAEEAEATPVPPPEDPTMYLTVPKLGLYDHTVRNDRSERALGQGAIKLPSTSFPWEEGADPYVACHRLGFPGTESYNQCLNLHYMQRGDEILLEDANGTVYEYRVSEALTVGPSDTWVTDPIPGREVVSLQTCIEAPGDFTTLGPDWAARYLVRADKVA